MTFFLRVLSRTNSGRNGEVLHYTKQLTRSLQHIFVEPHKRDQGNTLLGNLVSCVFYWRERRGTVKLPGHRGRQVARERRRVGNVESMTGVVLLVHGKVLLRAKPEQLRPATSAERVLGELQNTSLDEFTQVVNNLPKGVDLTGQVGPTEENNFDDTIMVRPLEETETSGEAEDPSEHGSEEVEPESDQNPSASASDQVSRLPVVPAVDPEVSESKTVQKQSPAHDSDLKSQVETDAGTSVVAKSQDQTQFNKASPRESVLLDT